MTTTTATARQAINRVRNAKDSLMQAERLGQALRAAKQADPHNHHLDVAIENARRLVYEMEADFLYEMDEAIAVGVNPDDLI